MRTIIISTGEELVCGRILDTNASYLAAELTRHGFQVERLTTVGDDPAIVRSEVLKAAQEGDLILISGGLGPTADDRTRQAIAEAAGRNLVEDPDSRRHVEDRLRSFGRTVTDRHLEQARFPQGAVVFANSCGTARGFACQVGKAWVAAMPGVPVEMVAMFSGSVLPFLMERLAPAWHVRGETVHIFPASESAVDERITDLTPLGRNPSVGITVRDGIVSVSVLARAQVPREAEALLRRDVEALRERFGHLAFGCGGATLASALSDELERRGLTVSVAESVTGGLIGHMLVDVPGISRFFLADIVAYSNEAKVQQLRVSRDELLRRGAVSAEVAESMARGICAATGSSLGLSTTGVAGPTGGTREKPVGLVFVGICLEGCARVVALDLRGDRWQIKDRAAKHALNVARLALIQGVDWPELDRTI